MTIHVEVFYSPGCVKCTQAKATLKSVVEELGPVEFNVREVNILEETEHAVELGVTSSPSIAIDGKLVFTSAPAGRELCSELIRRLA